MKHVIISAISNNNIKAEKQNNNTKKVVKLN